MDNSLQISSTGLLGPLKTQEYLKKIEEHSATSGSPGQCALLHPAMYQTQHQTDPILTMRYILGILYT